MKISSERQVETAVRQTAALARQTKEQGKTIVAVAGPVVVHTGGVAGLSKLIREHWIDAVLSGNALGVHDIESALFGTSLGIRMADGRQAEHGHRNHMRAINAIYHANGIKGAVESGRLKSGVMYECVKNDVPFVLAGSLRDDGPLPETITDMNEAQDAYAAVLKPAGLVICLGSMLHSIATGNMLPSWVKIVCVDITPRWRRRSVTGARGRRWASSPMLGCFSICSRGNSHERDVYRRACSRGNRCASARHRNLAKSVPELRDRNRRSRVHLGVPQTGLPDFGAITIRYVPDRLCLELKSLKMYTLAYRDLGIFQENVVNCFLRDIVKACRPVHATVTGEFASRGGLSSRMVATWRAEQAGEAK